MTSFNFYVAIISSPQQRGDYRGGVSVWMYMSANKIHNLKVMKSRRKQLRNNASKAEILLWEYLKESQLAGRKFRRQHSIKYFVLDFYCPSEKLNIELDGDSHNPKDQIIYDIERDEFLSVLDIKVIRIKNERVLSNIAEVLEEIKSHFK